MRYEARITAFDMLDTIHVAMVVYESGSGETVTPRAVLMRTATVQGTGELEASRWARDALVAMAETL